MFLIPNSTVENIQSVLPPSPLVEKKQAEAEVVPSSSSVELSCQNPNSTTTQPNITLSWVRHENDFANHPHPPPQKLIASNISAVTDPILMKL